jgi:2-amino-4-hydroxy-6-hydroxymethyldihydropteridine diphosphokinase
MAGIAYIGVGSNIDAYENCTNGIKKVIELAGASFLALSSLYRTSPVSPVPQDDFLNCVLKMRWSGSPRELLAHLAKVEQERARKRDVPLGPRTLDLDILLFDDVLLDTPDLVIPHPRLHERRFTLVPLLEIDPHLTHPRNGKPLASFLENIGDDQKLEIFGRIPEKEILPDRGTKRE